MRTMRSGLLIAAVGIFCGCAAVQTAGPEGHWQGVVVRGDYRQTVTVDLGKANSKWGGTFTAGDLTRPLENVTFAGESIHFDTPDRLAFDGRVEGRMDTTITARFTQIFLVSLARSGRVETGLGTYGVHHVQPAFFDGCGERQEASGLFRRSRALCSPTRSQRCSRKPCTLTARFLSVRPRSNVFCSSCWWSKQKT